MMISRKQFESILNTDFQDSYQPPHQLGPDYIAPADTYSTTAPDNPVKLRIAEKNEKFPATMSAVSRLETCCQQFPERIALSHFKNDSWVHWTYSKYREDIYTIAKAFIKLGLRRYQVVANLGFNAPEWFMAYYAAIYSGGISTGIYTTNSPEACGYILKHSNAHIVVVDDDLQLQKILQIRDTLPELKVIIQYVGTPVHEDVFSWDDVMKIGQSVPDEVLQKRIKSLAINECCSIVYTSGTTSNPKAVMLQHDNYFGITSFINTLLNRESHSKKPWKIVSFLPLNHVAGQIMDLFQPLMNGDHVVFALPDALKGSLISTLQQVQPNLFMSIPRVYEKMKENFEEKLASMSYIMQTLINWAMKCVYNYTKSTLNGKSTRKPLGYTIAEKIILKIRDNLGFSQMYFATGGGAPMEEHMMGFFMALGVVVQECYGLTESNGAVVLNEPSSYRKNSTGKVNEWSELKIFNPDCKGHGEICIRGRSIFMGYMHNEDATSEVIDTDGWLHTGDVGYFDVDNFLYITGRIKELVITSGGENVAPTPIEENIKNELPLISHALVIGDKKKYLTVLLTLKASADNPEMLSEAASDWCQSIGSNARAIADIVKESDQVVMQAIKSGIMKANKKAASNTCRVRKWKILPNNFSQETSEIGPTLKLRRHIIQEKYKDIIETMYNN